MSELDDVFNTLIIEFKRGTLTLAVLSQLKEPQYGYSLLQRLEDKNTPIEAGTLYPLLRRLEKQNILKSEWDTEEARPRKYYVLNEMGLQLLVKLKEEWEVMSSQIDNLLKEE